MSNTARVIAIALLASTSLAGCAGMNKWTQIEKTPGTAHIGRYLLDLPTGWMRLEVADAERVVASRDGVNLQIVDIIHAKGDAAFPNLKRAVPTGALPSDLAELQLADMQASPGIEHVTVLRNEPANLAGAPGYALHVRYKNSRGLRYERLTLGFAEDGAYYTLNYQAPTLHYFERDRATFDAVVQSLRKKDAAKTAQAQNPPR